MCVVPNFLPGSHNIYYTLNSFVSSRFENDHRLHKAPEPIPNSEAKLLLKRKLKKAEMKAKAAMHGKSKQEDADAKDK